MSIPKQIRRTQINLRLTEEDLAKIREAAKSRGVTMTELMLSATLDNIQDKGFKGTLRRMREAGEI